MTRRYATPDDFKRALEAHLMTEARRTGEPIARLRQLVVFDRFLARLQAAFPNRVVVKGGVALELRIGSARATKDIDASITGSPRRMPEELLAAAQMDLGDAFQFTLARHREHPDIVGDAASYGGVRFRSEARLGRTIYGSPFGVDVAFGHSTVGDPDLLMTRPLLDFVGFAATVVRAVNRETHIAEKLHAYTQPRSHPNSRVKDLPDLALLAVAGPIEAARVRTAILAVHNSRGTHAAYSRFPPPASEWTVPYARMAQQNGLPWKTLAEVTGAVAAFLDPVLAGNDGVWNPVLWAWGPA